MHGILLETTRNIGHPEFYEDLERRHVEIAVVEKAGKLGHVATQESPVLANTVTADRRRAGIDVLTQERESLPLGLLLGRRARSDAISEARERMLSRVPVVHAREHLVGLVDGAHWSFGDHRELLVGDYGRNLDDSVLV